MKTTRDDILTKAKIGTLEFVPTGCNGGDNPLRLAKHGAIGMNGQWGEGLGMDARVDTFQAVLTEAECKQLDEIKNAGKIVNIVHPIFGAYKGWVISAPWQAGKLDHVDVTITTMEEGEHQQWVNLPSLNAAAAAAKQALGGASGAFDNMTDAFDSGISAGILEDFDVLGISDAFDVFDDFVDDVVSGVEKTWQEAGAAYDAITGAVDSALTVIDGIEDMVTDAVDSVAAYTDAIYTVASTAREIVDAIGSSLTQVWRTATYVTDYPIDAILIEYLGEATDETMGILLDNNPGLIDMLFVPGGFELQIPVLN